ncbi:hypothetical protein HZB00_02385 [Candidatus Woesearchaeota archaeon]|nr:hypothetical protein [Candidatus Woesearchaeota archaeon]
MKGQLALQETILVVFILTVLLILGLFFFSNYQLQQIKQERQLASSERFHQMISTFPTLAEVSCSLQGNREPCLDTLKLTAFQQTIKTNPAYYQSIFESKNITVSTYYPSTTQSWQIYNQKSPSSTGKDRIITPISLYSPLEGKYSLGILVLEDYVA